MKKSQSPVSIVCLGSSLTEGNPHAEGDKWPTRLQWDLERARPGAFKVYNRGLAGNTSAQGLDRVDEAVMPLLPGHVIICYGINDCNVRPNRRTPRVGVAEFASNLGELIRLFRAAGGVPLLLAPHCPEPDRRLKELRKYDQGNGRSYADNLHPYHEAIRRVAQECDTPLIDMPVLLADAGVKTADIVIEDGVHPTIEGNRFYAEQVRRHFLSDEGEVAGLDPKGGATRKITSPSRRR